jgi:hypothetical protein
MGHHADILFICAVRWEALEMECEQKLEWEENHCKVTPKARNI